MTISDMVGRRSVAATKIGVDAPRKKRSPRGAYRPRRQARSNTGHVGISEVFPWIRSHRSEARRYSGFQCTWWLNKKRKTKIFFYHENDVADRKRALTVAIQFRHAAITEKLKQETR